MPIRKLKKIYFKHFIFLNYCVALIPTIFCLFFVMHNNREWFDISFQDFFSITAGIAATLFGFILTNISILAGLIKPVFKYKTKFNPNLIWQIFSVNLHALVAFGIIEIASLTGLISKIYIHFFCFFITLYCLFVSLLQIIWCIYILYKILRLSITDSLEA